MARLPQKTETQSGARPLHARAVPPSLGRSGKLHLTWPTSLASPAMLECALVRQDSLSECVPNVTFGCEPRLGARVWVTGGCRGWFTCGGSQVHCDGPAGTSCPCAASPALAQRGSSLLHMLPPPPAQFNRSRLHAMQCCQTNGAVAIDRATVNATIGPVTSLASCVTVCSHVRLCRFVSFTAPDACQLCMAWCVPETRIRFTQPVAIRHNLSTACTPGPGAAARQHSMRTPSQPGWCRVTSKRWRHSQSACDGPRLCRRSSSRSVAADMTEPLEPPLTRDYVPSGCLG